MRQTVPHPGVCAKAFWLMELHSLKARVRFEAVE